MRASADPPEAVTREADWHFVTASPAALLATGFGVGLAPAWPGTAGSLLGLALALPLRSLPALAQIAIIGAAFAVGVWACERAGRALGEPDAGAIVWDEVVGMAAVALLAPPGIGWALAGFAAFRAFDIVKPWPIRVIDRRLQNGFGVMLDDALAAACAAAAIAALHYGAGLN
jgi:phosphatidylglycerophosphatase A